LHFFIFVSSPYLYNIPLLLLIITIIIRFDASAVMVLQVLQEDMPGNLKLYRIYTFLHKKPYKLAREYRSLEILHKFCLYTMGPLLLILHSCMGHLSVFCFYSVIQYWNKLDNITIICMLSWGGICYIAWSVSLEIGGRFYEVSKAAIKSWKDSPVESPVQKKFLNKFRKSCLPLKMGTEGYFTIKRLSVLKFSSSQSYFTSFTDYW